MTLLRLDNVRKVFHRSGGAAIHAVNGVSLSVDRGETVALIGESGSGKSTTARLALRLYDPDSGSVQFDGVDLATLRRTPLRQLRRRMTMVFQEPLESLDPRRTVGQTIEEPLEIHEPGLTAAARRARAIETLEHVALNESFHHRYPHELSGGQQQRVGIARAVVTRPDFIALDEPTASLDVSVRAQILRLLKQLRDELDLAYLFVSHDIPTVEYIADRVLVMYLGQVVESGPTDAVFSAPQHPYTQALLSSTLSPDPTVRRERIRLSGPIPSTTNLPTGCFLHARCPIAIPECTLAPVPLRTYATAHEAACVHVPAVAHGPAVTPAAAQ